MVLSQVKGSILGQRVCSRIEGGPDDSYFCRRDISCSHAREKTHNDKSNRAPSGKMLIRTETTVGNMGAEQQKSVGGEERREIKGKLLVSNRGKKRRIIREKAESPAAQAEV